MTLTADHKQLLYILGMGVVSAVMYSTVFFAMAFLLPVLMVFNRFGFRNFLKTTAVSGGLVMLIQTVLLASGGDVGLSGFALLGYLPPVSMLAGTIILVMPRLARISFVSRALLAGLTAGLVMTPAVAFIVNSAEFSVLLDAVIAQLQTYMQVSVASIANLPDFIRLTLVNVFAASFFVVIFASTWLSSRFSRGRIVRDIVLEVGREAGRDGGLALQSQAVYKRLAAVGSSPLLPDYRVPANYVWMLLGAWSLILLNRYLSSGIVGALAWNTALALSICYAVQGLAVIFVRLLQTRMAPAANAVLAILLLLVVVGGTSSLIVGVILALIGTLETWLPLRNQTKGEQP